MVNRTRRALTGLANYTPCRRQGRSKTFTGCWTCRSRAIKCDETRPSCSRCSNSGLSCEGYGVRLVWPGETLTGHGKRRLIPSPALANQPLKSEDDLDHDLEVLDSIDPGGELTTGPFGVFSRQARQPDLQGGLVAGDRPSTHHETNDVEQSYPTPAGVSNAAVLYDQPSPGSEAQNELLQCWKARLSGLMTPIPIRDNIFTNIITPLAQQALTEYRHSPAHLALLHAVLAMTAFWRANISGANEHELGRRYLDSSLNRLTRCIRNPEHHHAILAAISTLLVIPAFTGEDPTWRIHLRGGIAWVESVEWNHSETSIALLQLFGFYEALIPVSGWIRTPNVASPPFTLKLGFGSDAQWRLDKVLGITKATMESIRQINLFLRGTPPTKRELDELELKIYRSDPTGITIRGHGQDCTELAQQHARLYHYSTHLYFSRCLKRVAASRVQHFVRSALDPIRRIHALEERHDVSGILWPYFIIACEALDTESRLVLMRYLDHRQTQGVGNTAAARRAILAVWKEREENAESQTPWIELMARDGTDILLL